MAFTTLKSVLTFLSVVTVAVILACYELGWPPPITDRPDAGPGAPPPAPDSAKTLDSAPAAPIASRTPARPADRPPTLSATHEVLLKGLEREVARLRTDVAALQQELLEVTRQPYDGRGESVAPDAEQQRDMTPDDIMAQQVADLEQRFRHEPRAANWASASEGVIADVFQNQELADSTLVYADCRETLCRIEVNHADPVAAEEFQMALAMAVSDHFPTQMTHWLDDASGERTLAFLIRD